MGYLRKTYPKIAGELLSLSQNQLRVLTSCKTGSHLNGHVFKLRMVDKPMCVDTNRQLKQSHKFSVTEALVALRFRNLVTYEPHIRSNSKCMDHFGAQPYVLYSVLCYSIPVFTTLLVEH